MPQRGLLRFHAVRKADSLPQRAALHALAAWAALLVGSCAGGEDGAAAGPAAPVGTAARPRPLPEPLKLVYRAIAAGSFEEARRLARDYLAAHPRDGQASFLLGLSYFETDNHGSARPHFERSLELDPDYAVARQYLGQSLFLLGDLVGARREYEALRAADPADPRAEVRLGTIELEESRLDEAAARFQRALELFEQLRGRDPRLVEGRRAELAGLHARIADLHFAREEYPAARDELLEATRICPENISAFFTLSLVYRRLGEDALAQEAAQRYESARRAILERRGSAGR